MTVHKMDQAGNQGPLCLKLNQDLRNVDVTMSNDIDKLTCIDCLRMLAKDAVLYGNQRKPARKW